MFQGGKQEAAKNRRHTKLEGVKPLFCLRLKPSGVAAAMGYPSPYQCYRARGAVTADEIHEAFQTRTAAIAEEPTVPDLYGEPLLFNPEKTVRIAVLHHHPILSMEAEKAQEDAESEMGLTFSIQ